MKFIKKYWWILLIVIIIILFIFFMSTKGNKHPQDKCGKFMSMTKEELIDLIVKEEGLDVSQIKNLTQVELASMAEVAICNTGVTGEK